MQAQEAKAREQFEVSSELHKQDWEIGQGLNAYTKAWVPEFSPKNIKKIRKLGVVV